MENERHPKEPPRAAGSKVRVDLFLREYPPSRETSIADFDKPPNPVRYVRWPGTLLLHCESCQGSRVFENDSDPETAIAVGLSTLVVRTYRCRNCAYFEKHYVVALSCKAGSTTATKVGEVPAFGGPLPQRLRELAGGGLEYLEKGLAAESQGFGIGAFAYYRRFVDLQKNLLFDRIIEVAELERAESDVIDGLRAAKEEHRFSVAMRNVSLAVPPSLMIRGQNPLSLLHGALSTNLHAMDDKECLRLATDIRTTLAALAERVAQALAQDEELKAAVTRIAAARRTKPYAK